MNAIWTTIIIVCFVAITVTNPNTLLSLCVESGTQAVNYTLQLVAIYALWQGVFCVAERCNLVEKLAKILKKLNTFLYGNISTAAQNYISLNMASNIVGVGNAATPSAIEAIKLMENDTTLSRGGAMLFVINACGLQLVPTTVIGMRASFSSQNPSAILLPTIVCTVATLVLGVFLVNVAYPKK
ncbi:MAG: hypothetical protein IJX23_05320 [Clostridia bacterium]|nr:hypothetical protein [Clostridia bacterium]